MENQQIFEDGVVASLRRNFGFIACPHRVRDFFFHQSALEHCSREQLREGTAVTFVIDYDESGKPIAKCVRLAPVGTRVQLTQIDRDLCLGQVSDPATPTSKGIIRFLTANSPDHILYDANDVQKLRPEVTRPSPSRTQKEPIPSPPSSSLADPPVLNHLDLDPTAQPSNNYLHSPPQPVLELTKGQLVLFRLATDTRSAQLAREAAARGAPTPRRLSYQWATELRPVTAPELAGYPHFQQQAALLELLEGALQIAAASSRTMA